MNEPKTTIDRRFSDTDAVATGWDETRRLLETAELFWIVTVRADGRPHVTPLVAVWLDGALHFCTAQTEQKAVNLRPQTCSLGVDHQVGWTMAIRDSRRCLSRRRCDHPGVLGHAHPGLRVC